MSTFPPEIWLEIFQQLDQANLKRLCEVCKHFNNLTTPLLYFTVTIQCPPDSRPIRSLVRLNEVLDRHPEVFQHTKALHIIASQRHRVDPPARTCVGTYELIPTNSQIISARDLDEDVEPLLRVMAEIPQGQLREFSWKIATCAPWHWCCKHFADTSIFNCGNQSNITKLDVVSHCEMSRHSGIISRSITLKSIRYLSFVARRNDASALKQLLRQNAANLEHLSLDLQVLPSHQMYWEMFLVSWTSNHPLRFPKLKQLTLDVANMSLTREDDELFEMFNFAELTHLGLNIGAYSQRILSKLSLIPSIKLESLHIKDPNLRKPRLKVVEMLLDNFGGLTEYFYSSFGFQIDHTEIWRVLSLKHSHSLQRLVYHQRGQYRPNNRDLASSYSYDRRFFVKRKSLQGSLPIVPFKIPLKFFGTCLDFDLLHATLFQLVERHALQVLHLRQSGPDIVRKLWPAANFFRSDGRCLGKYSDPAGPLDQDINRDLAENRLVNISISTTGEVDLAFPEHSSSSDALQPPESVGRNVDSGPKSSIFGWAGPSTVELADEPTSATTTNRETAEIARLHEIHYPELRITFFNFANWIFGPTGCPSLKILAGGDFSFEGRFKDYTVLLCRNEDQDSLVNFRYLTDDDVNLRTVIDKYRTCLEACPVDTLFEKIN